VRAPVFATIRKALHLRSVSVLTAEDPGPLQIGASSTVQWLMRPVVGARLADRT